MPESGLAKNRMKQYLENSGTTTTSKQSDVEELLQGKSIAKSLLAKWKSIENVKETSPEAEGRQRNSTSSNEAADGQCLPERGYAKNLLNKWQHMEETSSDNAKERRGPRPITPPPPEELERIAVNFLLF